MSLSVRWCCSSRPFLRPRWKPPSTLASLRNFSQTVTSAQRIAKDQYNYNKSSLFDNGSELDLTKFQRVTSKDLAAPSLRNKSPRNVKMLARDFIEDSLYNPHYGYFSKQVVIFSTAKPFDFPRTRDSFAFQSSIAKEYMQHGAADGGIAKSGPGRQIWHTPVELFQPWYGQAIAQCLVSEYLLRYFPYEDFIIYEMGAGNGTLAKNILDYLSVEYPQVYERTQYKIVEISPKLAELQRARLASHSCVRIVNKSIFDWDVREPAPCFFLALEVIDNFAHDVVRYDSVTLEPYQGITAIDSAGEFHELYEPVTDPLILRFLDYRRRAGHVPPAFDSFLTSSPLLRRLRNSLPFAPNMTLPEYVPTRLLTFLEKLRDNFPLHRLLLSDFSKLPDAVPGYNAPVVQTRYKETMVPCSTYMVQPGYFDIFFPTSFELLRDMYELLMSNPTLSASSTTTAGQEAEPTGYRPSPMTTAASSLRLNVDFFSSSPRGRRSPVDGVMSSSGLDVGQRMSTVMTHKEFLEKYADLERTTLRSGENPMLDFYQNVKFLF